MTTTTTDPAGQHAPPPAERLECPFVLKTTRWLGAALCLIALAWSIDLTLWLGFEFYDEQAMLTCLGLTFAIIFLRFPASGTGGRPSVPWYDALAAALGFGTAIYFVFRFDEIVNNFFDLRTEAFFISIVFLPLTWEALRRTAGRSLTIVFTVFLIYGFIGHLMPQPLQGKEQKVIALIAYLGADNVALLGLPLKIIVLTIVLFIFMGQVLLKSGAAEWFTELASAMMGRTRGGSAKIAIVASGLFGSISGSAVANVASTGVLTIPLMRQGGYNARSAAAIEAVASTGGQIMPPIMGAAAFLIAEFLEAAYTEVIIAALIPAFLYYLAVFIQADLEAAKNGIAALPEDQIPPLRRVLKEGWFFTVPYVVLIVALFWLNMSPQSAAFWATVALMLVAVVFGYKGVRLSPGRVWEAVTQGGRSSADIIVIGAMAGLIIGIMEKTSLGFSLSLILLSIGEGYLWLLLLLTALISIILGMGMPTSAIYILLATMITPSLIKLGVNPMAAHLYVLYFGLMSMITPPVAIAAFTAANLAGSKPMATGMTAVRLGWIAYIIPFVFVLSPSLLMDGTATEVLTSFITAVAGVWVASCGLVGYLFRPINVPFRVLFFAAGIMLLLPGHAFDHGITINILGAALAALVVGREYLAKRNGRAPAPAT